VCFAFIDAPYAESTCDCFDFVGLWQQTSLACHGNGVEVGCHTPANLCQEQCECVNCQAQGRNGKRRSTDLTISLGDLSTCDVAGGVAVVDGVGIGGHGEDTRAGGRALDEGKDRLERLESADVLPRKHSCFRQQRCIMDAKSHSSAGQI
jgi:hypothetical protein